MASNTLKNLNLTFVARNAPRSGPSSADAWNDSMEELAEDLANIALEWNSKIKTIIDGLPYGDQSSAIDAFVNGLDGKNMWVDQNVVSTDADLTFYDADNDRPVTVEEALTDLYQYIDAQISTTQQTIIDQSSALTTTQKQAIGINIFDASLTSSATSLDGKSERNRLNLIQLAQDMYGASYSLDNDGEVNLTNSIFAMVDALLELHSGNWSDDIALDHSSITGVAQASVGTSAPGNDSFAGPTSSLVDDLDQLRTEIKELRGTAAWTTANTALYAGGSTSLEGLLVDESGSGTKTATNPWGYSFLDLDDLDQAATSLEYETTGSGLPNGLPGGLSFQSFATWATGPSQTLLDQKFRRDERGVAGEVFVVYHGRGAYPIVQLVQLDPTVTDSGQFTYTVEHDNLNQYTVTMTPGETINSGILLSLW